VAPKRQSTHEFRTAHSVAATLVDVRLSAGSANSGKAFTRFRSGRLDVPSTRTAIVTKGEPRLSVGGIN